MTTVGERLTPLKQPKYKWGFHPNSQKNLLGTRWQKGQSGNPRGYSLTAALKDALRKPLKKSESGSPAADELIYSTIQGAILREPTPFKELWDRVEGRIPTDIPIGQDNRQYNIIISGGEDARARLERLLSGERRDAPMLIEGDSATK